MDKNETGTDKNEILMEQKKVEWTRNLQIRRKFERTKRNLNGQE